MDINRRTIATVEIVLIIPAALFMIALLLRLLQPLQREPAQTAQRIVMWYAGRVWTLWILLIGLPIAVLVIGCVTLLQNRIVVREPRQDAQRAPRAIRLHSATLIITAATLAAVVILAVVAVHMLTN